MKPLWGWATIGLLTTFLAACGQTPSSDGGSRPVTALASIQSDPISWPMGGQNYSNTRANNTQTITNITNVSKLALKWKLDTPGDVTATPAVANGYLYFPDWAGYVYKVDAKNGSIIWKKKLPLDFDPYFHQFVQAIARTSPALNNGNLYIGDQNGYVEALSAADGSTLWRTMPNPGPFPIITQSPVVYNGVVYVGTASSEENVAASSGYPCCSARGSIQALDANTGATKWQTYTTPVGYSGAAVWGSTPALDPASNTVYVTTGNNYSIPQSDIDCFAANPNDTACINPDNHVDSILALDMTTGAIKWATSALLFDNWNVACIFGDPANCPPGAGPDFDFGSGPNLFIASINGKKRQVIGAGQKSGQYWLLDAASGQVIWNTQVGPGSSLGGIEWGTATDGKRIYVAIANLYGLPYPNHPELGNAGSFAALDPSSGSILWQTKDPNPNMDLGAVSVSNGVVYAGSMSGHMYALDAANGKIAWDYLGNGSSNAGPAIDNSGNIYWGNGYERFGLGTAGHAFYAFSQGGK